MTQNTTPPNDPWLAKGEEKSKAVQIIFADIAPIYDRLNDIMSLSLHQRWRNNTARFLKLSPDAKVLDLCCGTGSFLQVLSRYIGSKGELTGMDFCEPMLEIARRKIGPKAELILGDVSDLPFENHHFDAITIGWGLRNVSDRERVLSESFRVLKKEGQFVAIDMAIPVQPFLRLVSAWLLNVAIPKIWLFSGQEKAGHYLSKSTQGFISRNQMKLSLEAAGFTQVEWKNFLMGNICMYWGKKA